MPYKDIEKKRLSGLERSKRCRLKKKIAKYGPELAKINMSGRHGNQARGPKNGRWNHNLIVTSHGYIAVRVSADHPHAWTPKKGGQSYAYEHIVVMMSRIGRPLATDEVVHHKNGDKTDNRPENLELTTRSDHSREHTNPRRTRDHKGRFNSNPRHVDASQFPEAR